MPRLSEDVEDVVYASNRKTESRVRDFARLLPKTGSVIVTVSQTRKEYVEHVIRQTRGADLLAACRVVVVREVAIADILLSRVERFVIEPFFDRDASEEIVRHLKRMPNRAK